MTIANNPNPIAAPSASGADSVVRLLLDQAIAIWKRRWLVFAIACAGVVLVVVWTLRQPKVYAAMTSLEFDPNPPSPLGRSIEGTDGMQNYWLSREYFSTQHRILESQRVAEGVVRQLGLQHDADFAGVPQEQRRTFRSLTIEQAAQVLRGRIRVEPVRESRLVNLNVEDTSPRRAQLIANTLAAVYIRQNLDQRLSSTVSSLEWLQQQLETLQQRLQDSELALYNYRRDNNLLSVSYEERRTHIGQRIEQLSSAVTEAQTRRIATEARVGELRRAAQAQNPLVNTAPELINSPLLQTLRARFEETRRERDALATRYGPNAQQMLAAEGRFQEITDAIRSEVRNILGAAEAELRTIRTTENGYRSVLNATQREALELNLREIEYGRLHRERENNAKLVSLVLERSKETDLSRMLRVNNVRVVDTALMPNRPIKPRLIVNIVGGTVGSLMLGIIVVFLLLQADRTVRSKDDVENELGGIFLGILPHIHTRMLRARYRYSYGPAPSDEGPIQNPDLVVHTHPTSSIAEACRMIRTNLLFMSPDKPFQTLMVSSAMPREGKTTSAISMAITLAQSGKKVVIVDTDLRRPRVHKAFKVGRPAVGVTSVLVGECTLEEALLETEVPNLMLLPCGPTPPNPAELLHSQRFHELLEQLKGRFDRVVFDTPPISAVTDALIIGMQTDATILVVRWRTTLRARANAVLSQLRSLKAHMAGVIMNDVDLNKDEGAYYYYYAGTYERNQDEAK